MISRAIFIQPARVYLATIMTEKNVEVRRLESLSQSVLEIIWLALFVSTFEPNFNFMID